MPGIEITAVDDGRDVHVLGYFFDPASAAARRRSSRAARAARGARARDRHRAWRRSACRSTSRRVLRGRRASRRVGRPAADRARAGARPVTSRRCRRRSTDGWRRASRLSCRAPDRAPADGDRGDSRRRRRGVVGASRRDEARRARSRRWSIAASTRSRSITPITRPRTNVAYSAWPRGWACSSPAAPISTATIRLARATRAIGLAQGKRSEQAGRASHAAAIRRGALPAPAFDALEAGATRKQAS